MPKLVKDFRPDVPGAFQNAHKDLFIPLLKPRGWGGHFHGVHSRRRRVQVFLVGCTWPQPCVSQTHNQKVLGSMPWI